MSRQRAIFLVALLMVLRAVMAGLLPLSADEAYYWLWSKHLDFGYFDHPPLIAWLIAPGALVFGDTAFGVRAAGVLLSLAASWLVWQSAFALMGEKGRAWLATLLFNLMLLVNAELLAATPDMPSLVASAAFLFALAKLQQSRDGRWWLAAGIAAGLGLLAKFSMLFLGAGAALWLLADPKARRWLASPWPWAGAALAALLFLPNLVWQASHQWETFAFQFGRIAGGPLTGRYLLEFFGAQIGLVTPFIFVLGVVGLARARRGGPTFLPAALMLPAIAYFLFHALHDRVQGNWPCFLYPMLALLAAGEFGDAGWRRYCSRPAMPLAGFLLLLAYGQALTGLVPLGGNDVVARLLGVGFKPVADGVVVAAHAAEARAVLTTDYETTAWLRFYEPGLTVIQVGETWRYPNAPTPSVALLSGPLLYFVEARHDRHTMLEQYFSRVELVTRLQTERRGAQLSDYGIFRVDGVDGPVPGKMP